MIKYTSAQITFREVPNEVSLSIDISNCPYKCKGCHSAYLQKNIGNELSIQVLDKMIDEHADEITCITFLGDGNDFEAMSKLIKHCYDMKFFTCMYTGSTDVDRILAFCGDWLTFLKTGPYIEKCGGLDAPTTNQQFFKINRINGIIALDDITYLFRTSEVLQ